MADVTTSFAAKDESFAKTVGGLQKRLTDFQGQTQTFSQQAGALAQQFAAFAAPIAGMALAFVGARNAVAAFANAIRIGGELNDLAARTGATAGELVVLQRAFENAGAGAATVGPVIDKLRRAIIEAGEGSKQQAEAFYRLGINLDSIKNATPTEQLQMVAKALSFVGNDTERAALAMDLLGRSGGELIPLLRAMGVELETARNQLGSYPALLNSTNQALDTIGDNFGAISNKATEFASGLLSRFAPALAAITTEIANIDAAGLGMMLSDYLAKFLETTAETYKLREALDNVKVAIQGIVSGNFADGLSLMWVTMKITALNAINEIVRNFVAGLQTVGQFLAGMFRGDGAFVHLAKTSFEIVAAHFYGVLMKGLADGLAGMGPLFSKAAQAAAMNAETATNKINMLVFGIGAQVDLVKEQAAAAGAALPQTFDANKQLLQPLFDLKKEYAEQKRLQDGILQTLQAQAGVVSTMATSSAIAYKNALFDATQQLEQGNQFANSINTSMNGTGQSVAPIAPAFSLAAGSGEDIELSLNNSKAHADKVQAHMLGSETAMGRVTIMGQDLEQSSALFANNIEGAKTDANVTADVFTGLSDRMQKSVDNNLKMIDKMHEAFVYGAKVGPEIYDRLRAGGMDIQTASAVAGGILKQSAADINTSDKVAADIMRAQDEHAAQMQRVENLKTAGQFNAAARLQRRANEELAQKSAKAAEKLKEGGQRAKESLSEGGKGLPTGGKEAESAMKSGGEKAGEAIKTAADALKDAASGMGDALALEATLKLCLEQLTTLNEKLPQNSLI